MSTIHIIAFSVVTGIETFIICVGNAFAIFVFWTQYTGSRRRSSYLLINLAVTDFFVGVSGLPSLIIDYIPSYLRNKKSEDSFAEFFPGTLFVLFSAASVVSLAAISVERTFAVLCPLAHRTTSNNIYVYCVAFIWVTGISQAIVYTLPAFGIWKSNYTATILNVVLLLCILITSLMYIIIRAHLKRSPQILDSLNGNQRQSMERNVKLSKTVFLVIALSFACWVPAVVLYVISDVFCKECIPPEVVLVGIVLHFGNSLVNPIAYICRLSIFKKTLKRLLKRRQECVELKALPRQERKTDSSV